MEKPGNHIVLVKIVEVLLNSSFIHRFGGAHRHRFPFDFKCFFQMDRIDTVDRFTQGAFGAQQAHLFSGMEEFIPKIGMGDADHGPGTLLEAFAE